VDNIDSEIQEIIEVMANTMYDAPGAGLAAVQVGIDKRILIYDIAQKEGERSLQVIINPEIISRDGQLISENEGCLSVPDYRADVKRSACVCVEGLDREGNPLHVEGEGYHAIALQHEIDHLNGILFIDHLSSLKKQMYKRRIKKQQRKDE
jgi:peptide deformylase